MIETYRTNIFSYYYIINHLGNLDKIKKQFFKICFSRSSEKDKVFRWFEIRIRSARWPRLNKLQNRDVRGRDSRLHNLSLCQTQSISTPVELHAWMCTRPTTSPLAEDNECPPRGLHRHNPVSRLPIVR